MAARLFVSRATLWRLERGDPTVAVGTVATAAFVLQFHDRLANLAAPASDEVALALDEERTKCLECERTFILEPSGPRYAPGFKDQVVAAYQDRMSTRGIRRTFGVCYETLMRWVGEKSGSSARLRGHAPAVRARRRARTR